MRCPHCAGQVPEASRFCGICGRSIAPSDFAANAAFRSGAGSSLGAASMSLFELPVSRGARMARILVVLALNLVLAGAGIAMIVSYFHERDRADGSSAPEVDAGAGQARVEILEPTRVEPSTRVPRAARRASERAAKRPRSGRPRRPRPTPSGGSPVKATPADSEPGRDVDPVVDPEKDPPGSGEPEEPAPAPNDPDPPETDPPPTSDGSADAGAAASEPGDREMEVITRRVAGVVTKNRGQFERCSRQVAKASGPVQGRVVIRFKVMRNGQAIEARAASNTTGSDRLGACLAAQFEGWTFPPHTAPSPIEFRWPLLFKSE